MSLSVIRSLYFNTTKATIQSDLSKAIDLFKALKSDEDRERAAVFMDGLSQMRSEWGVRPSRPGGSSGPSGPSREKRR